jgi:3-deoxy-D-manno-octulosonate 8-phosphate phosphatase (KDO 8-P phosphatase)
MIFPKSGWAYMVKLLLIRRRIRKDLSRLVLVIDIDGVLTDGTFYYGVDGKVLKRFGPHDAEASALLESFFKINFISADIRGSEITKLRLSDMGFSLTICSSDQRRTFIESLQKLGNRVLFLGDSISDLPALKQADFSFCPNDSLDFVAKQVNFRLKTRGGRGTLAELYTILKGASRGVENFKEF